MANSTRNNTTPTYTDGAYRDDLPLWEICTWQKNPRKQFDEAGILELVTSIEQHGVQQPIVVRYLPGALKPFQIVMGERRFRAATIAGLQAIPARIRVNLSDLDAMTLAVTENCQRRDLDAMEEAASFQALLDEGKTQQEVADLLGMKQSTIANRIRLLKLPEDVRQLVSEGKLGPSHAKALLRFAEFPAVVSRLAALAVEKSTPVKDLETGVPFGDELVHEKLLRELDYQAKFPLQGCKTCIHAAYFEAANWKGPYCFRPEEYDRKRNAIIADEKAAVAASVKKAQEEGGKVRERMEKLGIQKLPTETSPNTTTEVKEILQELPHIGQCSHGQYAHISPAFCPPEGCTEACPCRLLVMGHNDRIEAICVDPARHNTFKATETRAKQKRLRARFDVDFIEIEREAATSETPRFRQRVMAATIAHGISQIYAEHRRKVVDRMGTALPKDAIALLKDGYPDYRKLWATLGECEMWVLTRLAALLFATKELDEAHSNASSMTPIVNFLLEKKETAAPQKPKVIAIVVDPPYKTKADQDNQDIRADLDVEGENNGSNNSR